MDLAYILNKRFFIKQNTDVCGARLPRARSFRKPKQKSAIFLHLSERVSIKQQDVLLTELCFLISHSHIIKKRKLCQFGNYRK